MRLRVNSQTFSEQDFGVSPGLRKDTFNFNIDDEDYKKLEDQESGTLKMQKVKSM